MAQQSANAQCEEAKEGQYRQLYILYTRTQALQKFLVSPRSRPAGMLHRKFK